MPESLPNSKQIGLYGFSDELSKESTIFSSSSHNTVTTQVTFCRGAGLFTIATIATQVFQQISLRRCTKTHQKPLYVFAKQAFCPKTLRRCTKTVHSDAFLFATHVFRPFFLRRCTCVDHCDVFGWKYDTVVCKFNVKQCI